MEEGGVAVVVEVATGVEEAEVVEEVDEAEGVGTAVAEVTEEDAPTEDG